MTENYRGPRFPDIVPRRSYTGEIGYNTAMSVARFVTSISPFGPIFSKELRTTARRKRSYLLRVVYLGILLLALLMAWASSGRARGGLAARAQHQAELGLIFFGVFSGFCIIAMGLIGPVLTSTAIGSERLAKTLPVLLMTPISTWQIISGKLFSRLLTALTLIGLSLPVLALVRLLGGVELEQMIAVICLCTAFALGCASIGLFFSTLMNKAYAVILLSYATLGVIYVLAPVLIGAAFRPSDRTLMQTMAAFNPPFVTMMQLEPRMSSFFPNAWMWAVGVQLGLTALFVTLSGLILRRTARTAGAREATVNPQSGIPVAVLAPPPPLPAPPVSGQSPPALPAMPGAAQPPPLPMGAPLSGAMPIDYMAPKTRTRRKAKVREVSDHPILWRELRQALLPKRWQKILCLILCSLLMLLCYATMGASDTFDEPGVQIAFAVVFNGLAWLVMSVLAATAIATEKESDTWTVLLAAPVSGSAVVWGKAAGLYRRMLWPMALVAAHFVLFTLCGIVHPGTVVFALWVILTFNAVWVASGIALSLRMKKVAFSVIANLMLAVVIYLLPFLLLFVFEKVVYNGSSSSSSDLVEQGGWHNPYMYLGTGMDTLNSSYSTGNYYRSEDYWLPGSHHVTAMTFFTTVLTVGLMHLGAAWLILARTASAFDRIVGRAGRQAYTGVFETDDALRSGTSAAGGDAALAYAPLWKRGVAMLIDGILLRGGGVVLGAILAFILLLTKVANDDEGTNRDATQLLTQCVVGGIAFSYVAGWLYYALFERSRRRATPGKAMMGLYVTDLDGRRIGFARASLRYVASLLSGAIVGIGYLWALFFSSRQTLHDRVAGTIVLTR